MPGTKSGRDRHGRLRRSRKTGLPDLEELKAEITMDEHQIPLKELMERYNIENLDSGHTEEAVKHMLEKEGRNELTPPDSTPAWIRLLRHMTGGFATLLWIGAILSFIIYGLEESQEGENVSEDKLFIGIVLVAVVFITGYVSFYQEGSAANVMEDFLKLQPQKSKVLRDGHIHIIDAAEIVRGDIVQIKPGDRVPADLRIIESADLKVC